MSLEGDQIEHYRGVRQRLLGAQPKRARIVIPPPPPEPRKRRPITDWIYSVEVTHKTPFAETEASVLAVIAPFGETLKRLRGTSRDKNIILARRAAAEHLWAEGFSVSEIGRFLKKDHSTAINLLKPHRRKEKYQAALLRAAQPKHGDDNAE